MITDDDKFYGENLNVSVLGGESVTGVGVHH